MPLCSSEDMVGCGRRRAADGVRLEDDAAELARYSGVGKSFGSVSSTTNVGRESLEEPFSMGGCEGVECRAREYRLVQGAIRCEVVSCGYSCWVASGDVCELRMNAVVDAGRRGGGFRPVLTFRWKCRRCGCTRRREWATVTAGVPAQGCVQWPAAANSLGLPSNKWFRYQGAPRSTAAR